MNSYEEKVLKYIEDNRLIGANDRVIIGLSGGADSVCLFTILNRLRETLAIDIEAIHVHHGIRGTSADEDEMFARKLCESYGIDFTAIHKDIPAISAITHETEEECGRRIRYEIFKERACHYENAKIAVAHHMNDQAETVLFRMARGTGIKGMAGMKPQNDLIIRPLLCLSRREIEEYLANMSMSYRQDPTNEDTEYSRNYIRKNMIPGLETINTEALKHICTLTDEINSIIGYLDKQVDSILDAALVSGEKPSKYQKDIILKQDDIIKTMVIRKIIEQEGLPLKDIHREHIDGIISILEGSESKQLNLPKNVVALVENNQLSIGRNVSTTYADWTYDIEGDCKVILPSGGRLICRIFDRNIDVSFPQDAYTKWLDYDKIQYGLNVRYRRFNDSIVINSAGNKKKLSDYMIDEKIPKSHRDEVPLIAEGTNVHWIIGHRISEVAKITDNTTKIIEIKFEKEN